MKILKNYIESNWVFDLGVVTLIPISIWLIISQDSQLVLLASFSIGLSAILFYRVFCVSKKIKNYERQVDQIEPVEPTHTSKMNYYNLGIELKKDSKYLDIFKNRKLEHSIKIDSSTNSTIVFLETTWYNWNWRYRGEDHYYQILLESEKNSIELLRFKETSYKKDFEKTDFEDYSALSNELANLLEIKIKDCAQQRI